MKITFLGHASLQIDIGDITILVDPFISGNPKAAHIDLDALKADYILLTHAHQDHVLDVEAIANTSSFPDASYGGQPGGFVIEGEHKNIYIAGDTALTYDMKLIPLQTQLDLAILPIGDNFTMGIDDALIAADFVECDKILGYHFDTFGYIEIDHESAKRKFFENNKDLMLLEIGDSIEL